MLGWLESGQISNPTERVRELLEAAFGEPASTLLQRVSLTVDHVPQLRKPGAKQKARG